MRILTFLTLLFVVGDFVHGKNFDSYSEQQKIADHGHLWKRMVGSSRQPLKVFVAGGSRGIGLGFAEYFLAMGADVTIVSGKTANDAVVQLRQEYPERKIEAFVVDLSNKTSLDNFFKNSENQKLFENIDLVINSAGTVVPDLDKDGKNQNHQQEWQKMMAIKEVGARVITSEFTKRMLNKPKQGLKGAIIQVSSVAALYQFPTPMSGYAKSNEFMLDLADQVYRESQGNIYSVAIAPGLVETDMTVRDAEVHPEILARWGDSVASMILSSGDIMLDPSAYRERFVHRGRNVFIPGNRVNLRMYNSYLLGQKYLGTEAMNNMIGSMLALQYESANWSSQDVQDRMKLMETMMSFAEKGDRIAESSMMNLLDPFGLMRGTCVGMMRQFFGRF